MKLEPNKFLSHREIIKDFKFIEKLTNKWERYDNAPKILKFLFKPRIPKPPYNFGAKVKFKLDLPISGYKKNQTYTIHSMFLSIKKDMWFVRTREHSGSTLASDFEWIENEIIEIEE